MAKHARIRPSWKKNTRRRMRHKRRSPPDWKFLRAERALEKRAAKEIAQEEDQRILQELIEELT